jgi:hypothetical protein
MIRFSETDSQRNKAIAYGAIGGLLTGIMGIMGVGKALNDIDDGGARTAIFISFPVACTLVGIFCGLLYDMVSRCTAPSSPRNSISNSR